MSRVSHRPVFGDHLEIGLWEGRDLVSFVPFVSSALRQGSSWGIKNYHFPLTPGGIPGPKCVVLSLGPSEITLVRWSLWWWPLHLAEVWRRL